MARIVYLAQDRSIKGKFKRSRWLMLSLALNLALTTWLIAIYLT